MCHMVAKTFILSKKAFLKKIIILKTIGFYPFHTRPCEKASYAEKFVFAVEINAPTEISDMARI